VVRAGGVTSFCALFNWPSHVILQPNPGNACVRLIEDCILLLVLPAIDSAADRDHGYLFPGFQELARAPVLNRRDSEERAHAANGTRPERKRSREEAAAAAAAVQRTVSVNQSLDLQAEQGGAP
jgi:hypothetical protein